MNQDLWVSEEWKKNPALQSKRQPGLKMKYDKEIKQEVKRLFQRLAAWIRERFYFPIQVSVYVKTDKRVKARDGDACVSVSFLPDSFNDEPDIKIATGDYEELIARQGILQARAALIHPLLHELTHYFQWINSKQLTPIGENRQANHYADNLLEEYLQDNGLLEKFTEAEYEAFVTTKSSKFLFLSEAKEVFCKLGFRKKRQYWYLSLGEWLFCISVQNSRSHTRSSRWNPDEYYVNFGMAKQETTYPTEKRWFWWHRCNTKSGEVNLPLTSVLEEYTRYKEDFLSDNNMTCFLKRNKAFQSCDRWIIP